MVATANYLDRSALCTSMDSLFDKIRSLEIQSVEKSKLTKLRDILQGKSVICAFSGGIDSSLLLIFSKVWANRVLAITIASEFIPKYEIENASKFSKQFGIDHDILTVDILENQKISGNPKNRCYICKKQIFEILLKIAKINNTDFVLDGTNLSDCDMIRPGFQALKELAVRSPFVEAKITKSDIINISKELKLPSGDLPPMACLASRVPYNKQITKEILTKIEKAEEFLRTNIRGIEKSPLRVRYDEIEKDIPMARIEVDPEFLPEIVAAKNRQEIVKYFESIGFCYTLADLSGFESGKIDRLLKNRGQK